MKKILLLTVLFLLITSVMLAGCNPAPEPTPTPTATIPDETPSVSPTPTATGDVVGNNPAIKEPLHFNADPTARQWNPGGSVYVYGTYDTVGDNAETEWHVFSSRDLVNWTDHGKALSINQDDPNGIKWATKQAWAPDCYQGKDGKYYFYFPVYGVKDVCGSDGMHTGVAVSDSPTGPFKDALGKPLLNNAHDPAVFKDDDKYYLYTNNRVVQLGEDMISLAGTPKTIEFRGEGNLIGTIDPETGKTMKFEAVYVFKRNGVYYWTCALKFNTLIYYTGTSPDGPFTYGGIIMNPPDPTVKSNNHHSVINYEGRWLLFYHQWLDRARRTCIEYLKFNADGTIQEVKRTKEGVTFPYPSN